MGHTFIPRKKQRLPIQRADFAGLFKNRASTRRTAIPSSPVPLIPLLHEFLQKRENLIVDVALPPLVDAKGRKESASRYKMAVKDLKKEHCCPRQR